jgi:hypothetical protein
LTACEGTLAYPVVLLGGFDVHGAVRIAADDDEGRERLIRYCARVHRLRSSASRR